MKLLYVGDRNSIHPVEEEFDFQIKIFTPSIFGGVYVPNEQKMLKTTLLRLYFTVITHGKAKIFYAIKESNLLHTSYILPKCFKFPFLSRKDYFIGPCLTYPQFRGRGIYPSVIRTVVHTIEDTDANFYMVVDSDNAPSIRGIEKAGFLRCGTIYKTRLFKRYKIKKENI